MEIVIIGNGPAAVKALEAMATYEVVTNAGGEKITINSCGKAAPYSPI